MSATPTTANGRALCPTPGCGWPLRPGSTECFACTERAERAQRRVSERTWLAPTHDQWSRDFKAKLFETYLLENLGLFGTETDRRQRGWEKLLTSVVGQLQLNGRRYVTDPGEAYDLFLKHLARQQPPATAGKE